MKNTLQNLIACSATILACHSAMATDEGLTIESLLGNAEQIQSQMVEAKRTEAFVLVSFSMPEQSLSRLAQDAKDAGIPLVFRGVPYKETEENKQAPLLTPKTLAAFSVFTDNGVQVELNPEVFDELSISQVPALVIQTSVPSSPFDSTQCAKPSEDKTVIVQGDVTLGYMLDSLLDRNDDAGRKAQELRRLLGGRQ